MHDEIEEELASQETFNPDFKELVSVGIDIGSSTSHLMFSRLLLERRGLELSSHFEVVKREAFFRSPVLLTPYQDKDTIDTEALGEFITRSYNDAGVDPHHVDTGAVICTGEAVKKKNAEAIVRLFADQGGKFVCATAGPNLEAVLAAHGSGAVASSRNGTILNVDIGGGTTKLAIVKNGAILETACINVGARLVSWDSEGKVNRIEESGAKIASWAGVSLELGKPLSQADKIAIAETMAEVLLEFLECKALSSRAKELLVTPLPEYTLDGAQLYFSGGVSEYIYGRETQEYGDLGPLLAQTLQQRIPALGLALTESVEGLRATVIGASQYTIQVSSSTIFLSQKNLLPIRDLLVVTPWLDEKETDADGVAKAIESAFRRFDLIEHPRPVALSIRYPWENSYQALSTLAMGVLQTKELWQHQNPLVLVLDADIGKLVGAILKEDLNLEQEVVAIDEIIVGDLDFIDIGEELSHSQEAVPVVVKSLIFK
ncbi:MAG: ethanolamine ammonia-lyase reactivating factor EutA [Dehalococcoidales bacterium]|nr:ethanolamine ammonia-lyase reactivating factor EutA [Dehalococcoidales bacterium]